MNSTDSTLSFKTALNLLDNAFKFVEPAISTLKKFETHSYSYVEKELQTAILSVTTGVELILKAKIAAKDWRELFQNPNKSDRRKFLSGEFYSLRLEDCISRIEILYKVQINQNHKTEFDQIRQIRNKLIHFYLDVDRLECITLIATCIDIFIEFYRDFIITELFEEYDRTAKIDNTLKYVQEYVRIRLKSINKKLDSSVRPLTYHLSECGNCEQDTYIIKDNKEIKCLFCGFTRRIEEIAKEWSENRQTKRCPTCDLESLFLNYNGDDSWECFLCGYYTDTPTRFLLKNGTTTFDSKRLDSANICIITASQ